MKMYPMPEFKKNIFHKNDQIIDLRFAIENSRLS